MNNTEILQIIFIIIIVFAPIGLLYLYLLEENKTFYKRYNALKKQINENECSHGVRPLTKEAKEAMKTRRHK